MKISGINFPKPMLDALRNDGLVVFAGAGVSMGEPSSLPSFKGLTKAISEGTGEALQDHEPEDRFLGRLLNKGVKVPERARQILSADGPEPTALHYDLLRLYSSPLCVRIVTTNFDLLFEQAAESVFASQPEVFNAPALPLGSEFRGIVHVHGSLDCASDMVLTDVDFGRAYLTEGSARRFLVELFRSFTVLFVGYSHSDTVMNYLARALPPSERKQRFVLTDEAGESRWQLLGIEPISYPKPLEADHHALYEGVRGLAEHINRGILGWQREITEIANQPPPIDETAIDLIDDALSNPTRTRFFADAASHQEWINWLDRRKHLDSLFGAKASGDLCERDKQLALWLAEKFAHDHTDELFLLIARHDLCVHPYFWYILGHTIGLARNQRLDADALARWVSLLLATVPSRSDGTILVWLGERCVEAGLTDSLLDIFGAMAASRIVLKPGFGGLGDGKRPQFAELTQVYDHYELNELWEKGLKPRLERVAEPLLAGVVQDLIEQHRTLCSWQSATRNWDPINSDRSAIEPHEQDGYPEAIYVLIDAARDCLEYLVAKQPAVAASWCNRLVGADAPLLRRLAVHALSVRKDLNADEKIDWLLTSIGLHDLPAHHETFQAMRAAYPDACPGQRKVVIDEVLAYVWPRQEEEDKELYAAYKHFNWLHWLQNSDPSCELAKQSLEDILKRYPDLQSSEHPDLTHYSTGGWGWMEPQSAWSVDELLLRPGIEWVDDLLSFREKHPLGPDRDGLSCAVEEASIQNFEWGLDLADALAESGHWDSDLWPSLMRAWSRELDVSKHREVLDRLGKAELYPKHVRSVTGVLHAIAKDGDLPYAADLLPKANQIATALWGCLDQKESLFDEDDWLMRAINHPAGDFTQFWLESLALWRKQQDPSPDSLGDEYSPMFSRIVQDKSLTGRFGKSVLTSQFGFILAADESWATRHLIPLFEDTAEPDDRQAVWHGFLYGRLYPNAANTLEDAFLKAIPYMGSLFPVGEKVRQHFVGFYTAMVTYYVKDPLDLWIPRFFENADVEDRCRFAWDIGEILDAMNDAEQHTWWERWLKRYWENRLQGIPVPLDAREVEAILGWLPSFKSVFPEAVELTIQMPQTPLEHDGTVYKINKGELWSKYPEATAKVLIHLADFNSPDWIWLDGKELIEKLLQLDLPIDLRTKLEELPPKLGLGTGNP